MVWSGRFLECPGRREGGGANAKGRNGFLKLFSMIFIEISVYRMYA